MVNSIDTGDLVLYNKRLGRVVSVFDGHAVIRLDDMVQTITVRLADLRSFWE